MLGRIVALVILTPLILVTRFLLRPTALMLYRISFPLHLWIQNRLAVARNRFLFPLTTRAVIHVIIGFITIVVTTNSLAAKEVHPNDSGQRTLLAQIVTPDAETELTYIATATPIAKANSGELSLTDAAVGAEGTDGDTETDSAFTEVSSLEPTNVPETVTAGQPRADIVHYTVQGGDTISTIAGSFGITQRSVRWANNLTNTDYIKPGQDLTIPPVSGVLHQVKSGDTLQGIANKYHANLENIQTFNHLAAAEAISTDQVLVIPGGEVDAPPQPVQTTPRFVANNPSTTRDNSDTPPPSAPSRGSGFGWPTGSHRINQGFKPYAHRALDIDGDVGSPIYAAEDGRVLSVVYQRYGYGYHVVVSHGGGIETLYAHASKIFVKPGDSVKQGQTIALVGLTGRTTGAHLHFEVFEGSTKVNPFNYVR